MTDELSRTAIGARKQRIASVRERMAELEVDGLMLSLGADMPWLTGYLAMPLERITCFVLTQKDAVLVVPELEAPRVPSAGGLFEVRAWRELEDPIAMTCAIVGSSAKTVGISDRAWATFLLAFQKGLPNASWVNASKVTSPIRAVKDESELAVLRAASAAADRVAEELQSGEIPLIGRSEAEVSDDLAARLVAEGHAHVNFAIVGSGPNGASPHHHAGSRVIGQGDTVVCDFGGTLALEGDVGYCSDITRTVCLGEPGQSDVLEYYEVLKAAQAAGVERVKPGVTAQSVDEASREVIDAAGLGERFIHRTGHGIGIEEHEDPYIVKGNEVVLEPGHCFSIEPGIYIAGEFGMRLEDIVAVTSNGVERLNKVDHSIVLLDA
jgi:Xaa-Pro aminopeptidase